MAYWSEAGRDQFLLSQSPLSTIGLPKGVGAPAGLQVPRHTRFLVVRCRLCFFLPAVEGSYSLDLGPLDTCPCHPDLPLWNIVSRGLPEPGLVWEQLGGQVLSLMLGQEGRKGPGAYDGCPRCPCSPGDLSLISDE